MSQYRQLSFSGAQTITTDFYKLVHSLLQCFFEDLSHNRKSKMSVPLIIDPTSPLLSDPNVVILDASWLYQPDPPTRNAYKEFVAGPRFPNARFWDLDAVSEPHPDGYILMLPSPERFAEFAGKHGISKNSHVVVYDSEGIFSSPRTVWTFKVILIVVSEIARVDTDYRRFMDMRKYQ